MDVFALWEEIGAPEQAHQARGEQKSLKGSAARTVMLLIYTIYAKILGHLHITPAEVCS